jgi:hypothetical protein
VRSLKLVTVTRRMTRELPAEYDALVAGALRLAAIVDDPATREADVIRAEAAWQERLAGISQLVADSARRESSWQEHRPRAV